MVSGWMGTWTSPLCPAESLSARENTDPEFRVARTSPVHKVLPRASSGSLTHQNKHEGENLSQHVMTSPGGKQGVGEGL